MSRTATVSRVFTFGAPLTFSSPAELAAWLAEQGITPAEYGTILTNLGYTPKGGAMAIEAGHLTGAKILEAYGEL